MRADQRSVRMLLIAVFVPVAILVGVLATAVLGSGGPEAPQTVTLVVPAPVPVAPPVVAPPAAAPPAAAPPAAAPPAAAPPAATPAVEAVPPSDPTPPIESVPPSDEDPPTQTAPPATAVAPEPPVAAVPQPAPQRSLAYVPEGAERFDVGSGAEGAAIFRPSGTNSAQPGPVVIFLHGWVAIDPERYGPWIGHLVRGGATVIYPAYQTRPAYDTIRPLANVLAGVRAAFEQVRIGPGRLIVAGHSAGGALAADYAALATANGLPPPNAVFSVYPGRKLRHLAVPIPSANMSAIPPGTRVLVLAGERDTAVGTGTARRIASGASQADVTLQIITDDAADQHSDPRRFDGAAQRTFWQPLDELLAASATVPSP